MKLRAGADQSRRNGGDGVRMARLPRVGLTVASIPRFTIAFCVPAGKLSAIRNELKPLVQRVEIYLQAGGEATATDGRWAGRLESVLASH